MGAEQSAGYGIHVLVRRQDFSYLYYFCPFVNDLVTQQVISHGPYQADRP